MITTAAEFSSVARPERKRTYSNSSCSEEEKKILESMGLDSLSNCGDEDESVKSTSSQSQAVGAWTDDEHKTFLRALEMVPATCHNRWKMIASLIPTRNATQVRTHAIKYFRTVARRQAREAKRLALQQHHLARLADKSFANSLDTSVDYYQARNSWSAPSMTDSIRSEFGLAPLDHHGYRLSEDDCIDWLVNYYSQQHDRNSNALGQAAAAVAPLPAPVTVKLEEVAPSPLPKKVSIPLLSLFDPPSSLSGGMSHHHHSPVHSPNDHSSKGFDLSTQLTTAINTSIARSALAASNHGTVNNNSSSSMLTDALFQGMMGALPPSSPVKRQRIEQESASNTALFSSA